MRPSKPVAVAEGAEGIVRGVTVTLPEGSLSPATFVATTLQPYVTPLTSEDTVTGEEAALPVLVV
jgi:hypothetical protein